MRSPSAFSAARASHLAALLLALAGCTLPSAPPPSAPAAALAPQLRLIGTATVPTGFGYGGTTVGGLSGIDYDPASDRYWMISDDRGSDGPARLYSARIRYDAGRLEMPQFTSVQTLQHDSGAPYAPWWRPQAGMDRPDAEALRWLPGTSTFVWTSEGDFGRGFAPQLRVQRSDGRFVRNIALPASFAPPKDGDPPYGPRGNGTLEGIALSGDGRSLWLAMELPWHQDGERADAHSGGAPVRITAIDLESARVLRQIAYPLDAVWRPRLLPGPQVNGVSDILADGDDHLLVLERSYGAGRGFGARVYRIDPRSGSDTQALAALTPGNHRPVAKTLVADLAALGITPDNVEGMTWGPALPGGACVLVFVSDNNFNPAQVTQFIAAQYLPPPPGHGRCATNVLP